VNAQVSGLPLTLNSPWGTPTPAPSTDQRPKERPDMPLVAILPM
jgi:hypothetical protein